MSEPKTALSQNDLDCLRRDVKPDLKDFKATACNRLLDTVEVLQAENAAYRERLAACEGALRPFSNLGGDRWARSYQDLDDDVVVYMNSGHGITAGDVRAVRAALAGAPPVGVKPTIIPTASSPR